jgi:hypothetical protein
LGVLLKKTGRKKLDITATAITAAMMSAIIPFFFCSKANPPFGEAGS